MPYKLKPDQPDFQTVDGSMPLVTFRAGETYETIPPEEAHRFQSTDAPAPPIPSPPGGEGQGEGNDAPGGDQ